MSDHVTLDEPRRVPAGGSGEVPPPPASSWPSIPRAIWRILPHSWSELLTITIAVVSLAISLDTSRSQTHRELRQQLTDTLDRRMAITLEIQKLNQEMRTTNDPQMVTALQNDLGILGAQDYALIAQAAELARQIPDEVAWMDYAILANGFAIAGDLENAEKYYLQTIGAAPSDFAAQWAKNGYAWFLLSQPARLEDGRAQFEEIIALISNMEVDEELRRGYLVNAYKAWAQSEANLGNIEQVDQVLGRGCEVAKSSELPRVRDALTFDLNQLWTAVYQFYGAGLAPQCQ